VQPLTNRENLHYPPLKKAFRAAIALLLGAACLAASYFVIKLTSGTKNVATAIFIAVVNALLPLVMKVSL
jgi:hypothetical protein